MNIEIKLNDNIEEQEVVDLYLANQWTAADKPKLLVSALRNSDTLVTARDSGKLVGIGNALSDGHLVVYYSHMLVNPSYQGMGIGRKMMGALQGVYGDFHQQVLIADGGAFEFYKAMGFERAATTIPMWIYKGREH